MKTVTILLSFAVNDHNIVHLTDYQTDFTDCYQAEQAVLDQAFIDYVSTGKAHTVTVESCVPHKAVDKQAEADTLVTKSLPVTLVAQ